ncbi:hypothetical protein [Aestuariispira insulae]|uniref:Uncharacterized protein n=1 Tax=Aestuariispira insulae TaxID=1461337 RepID=A0A3D9HW18_9PROT|nr:hypothetical protein [Aestuariispira insulae]RED53620.1 hypothetical protein DFP90_101411 [Aestuariispira insulae]
MKQILFAAAFLAMPLGMMQPASAEKLACDELLEVVDALDAIADALDAGADVDAGDDEMLLDLTVILEDIANAEGDSSLIGASNAMNEAWVNNDRDAFINASDRIANTLENLRIRDCE